MNEPKPNLSHELYLTLRRIQQQIDLLAQQVDVFVVKYCPDELTDAELDKWIDTQLSDKQEK